MSDSGTIGEAQDRLALGRSMGMARAGKVMLLGLVLIVAWTVLSILDAPPADRETVVVKIDRYGYVCVPARPELDRAGTECGTNETGASLRAGDCVKISYDDESHMLRADAKLDCPV